MACNKGRILPSRVKDLALLVLNIDPTESGNSCFTSGVKGLQTPNGFEGFCAKNKYMPKIMLLQPGVLEFYQTKPCQLFDLEKQSSQMLMISLIFKLIMLNSFEPQNTHPTKYTS